ncbi:MAG: LLM class flavin-dependent oxidoreductase [Actinomycetota bacterium]
MTSGATWGLWLEPLLPPSELAALAREAEDAGASHVFVADEGTERDLFVVLAVIAQATSTVLLGAGVTNPFTRHPVTLAAAFATLAELVPGRVVAGFGTGGSRTLAPMDLEPSRPYSALVQCLDVVERLLAGKEVTFDGEFAVRGARLSWSPGPLPIATAGRGPKVESLGATRADWILLSGKPVDLVPRVCAGIREAGAAAGNVPRIAWSAYIGWDEAMLDEVRPHFTYIATDMPADLRRAAGIDDRTAERIRTIMLEDGMDAAARLVPDHVVRQYAVVADRDRAVAELARVREDARPDMFLLPVNDYTRAGEFVQSAAGILIEAGFREAR